MARLGRAMKELVDLIRDQLGVCAFPLVGYHHVGRSYVDMLHTKVRMYMTILFMLFLRP